MKQNYEGETNSFTFVMSWTYQLNSSPYSVHQKIASKTVLECDFAVNLHAKFIIECDQMRTGEIVL